MKIEQKISDLDAGIALNYLANNWKQDPTLHVAIAAILEKLKVGSQEDKQNAEVLEKYLSYPGSEHAFLFSSVLHKALREQDGRRAVGLPPKKRSKLYSASLVKQRDHVLEMLVRFELGKASANDVEISVIAFLGDGRDKKTIDKFIEELRPRAKMWADFQRFLVDSERAERKL
jgi:hypothetical protein